MTIERCTLVGNMGVAGSGVYVDGTSTLIAEKSIIAFGYKGEAVACDEPGGTAFLSCCDVFQNEYGNWIGCISGQNGVNGNIEIAPLIGIADRVADITQTGTTLRENRLRVVEEILASSARFIVNPVSLRTESERVTTLARRLADVSLQ